MTDSKHLRELCAKATSPRGEIDPHNPVWGPRLREFQRAIKPAVVLSLLDENDRLRAALREACGIAGVFSIELNACYAELDEPYDLADHIRIGELSKLAGEP